MATAESRPPRVVLESITNQAERVRQAAAELTKRIEHFQEWLGNVSGRVETDYYGAHPDAKSADDAAFLSLVIRLHRNGKKWILSFATHEERHSHEEWVPFSDFKPLVDAPLKFKMAAVKMFPNILAAIEKSQVKLVAELDAATSEYDAFAATLIANDAEADHRPLSPEPSKGGGIRKARLGRCVDSDATSSGWPKKEGN